MLKPVIALAAALCLFAATAAAQQTAPAPAAVKWSDALKQKPDWYSTDEAVRVADNVLLYQRDSGGWPKNLDMAKPLNEAQAAALAKEKGEADSTIDNGATYAQLAYLGRVYSARKLERHRDAFLRGVDFLLKAQYENGGWPQYYPPRKGYYTHITFNDGAMINVMRLLRDVSRQKAPYDFVDAERRASAARAVERGLECILKTQVVIDGKRTAWAAQYDEKTLEPAPARKFEPVSLTGLESVDIVQFLMNVPQPDARVRGAIESAVEWFRAAKVSGVRWVEKRDPAQPGGFERAAVKDPKAPPIWARFYEIGTNRPIFIGRDAVIHYDVSEIEAERRNGYRWYTDEPAELLEKDYPAWQKKWGAARN
ncbi:MAG TPA: pectate lyase [Pyrinomonadaceae bacterium]|jgi:PelA/Pel-15E family pectate lyase|nr:pectate lyase [Pyrinomonadaceae bacterium]